MFRFYFFVNRRVDGRMKLFPLAGQTTYANHGSTHAPEEEVNVDTEVQMNIQDRALVCSYPSGIIFGVKLEGSSRRQVRLMAYSDRGRTYYKASGIVPILFRDNQIITDPDCYHDNRAGVCVMPDEELIEAYRAYVRNRNGEAPGEETAESFFSERPETAEQFPFVVAGRMEKVANIANHLADCGIVNAEMITQKFNLSLLLDAFATAGARFKFRKQNGNIRNAVGTLREDIIMEVDPTAFEDSRERIGNNAVDGAHVVYYDLEKRDWRSFCTEDFLGFVDENGNELVFCERIGKESCLAIASAS